VLEYGLRTGVAIPDAVDRALRARPPRTLRARSKSPGARPDRYARGPTACLTASR